MEKRKALPEYCTSAYMSHQILLKSITSGNIVHENAHEATVPKACVQGWGDGRGDKGKEGKEEREGKRKREKEREREREWEREKKGGKR